MSGAINAHTKGAKQMSSKGTKESCTCTVCVAMCCRRPCFPTPEDAVSLITAGLADRLMVDWYIPKIDGDSWELLTPAIKGHENSDAPFWPVGRCTFLKDDRCELHEAGLKPTEGKECWCGSDAEKDIKLHHEIAATWNSIEGLEIVRAWRGRLEPIVGKEGGLSPSLPPPCPQTGRQQDGKN